MLDEKDKTRKQIGCKWVFKIKRNETFWERLVAQGYKKNKVIDYDANNSPVVKDICHRIVMAKMITNGH